MTDTQSVNNIIEKTKPDEVYNLAAQSHVAVHLKFLNIHQMQMHKVH